MEKAKKLESQALNQASEVATSYHHEPDEAELDETELDNVSGGLGMLADVKANVVKAQ